MVKSASSSVLTMTSLRSESLLRTCRIISAAVGAFDAWGTGAGSGSASVAAIVARERRASWRKCIFKVLGVDDLEMA